MFPKQNCTPLKGSFQQFFLINIFFWFRQSLKAILSIRQIRLFNDNFETLLCNGKCKNKPYFVMKFRYPDIPMYIFLYTKSTLVSSRCNKKYFKSRWHTALSFQLGCCVKHVHVLGCETFL